MTAAGKLMIAMGLVLALVGAIVWALGRSGFRGMPGDVKYQGENVRFYFPIVTCIVLSVLLTGLMWLWQWISRR